jgi:hypothetical protein
MRLLCVKKASHTIMQSHLQIFVCSERDFCAVFPSALHVDSVRLLHWYRVARALFKAIDKVKGFPGSR